MNFFAEPYVVKEIRTSTCAKNASNKTTLSDSVADAKISTSIPKLISENIDKTEPSTDCIAEAEPSALTPQSMSKSNIETELSTSTAKSKPTALECIGNAMLTLSATSVDYLTIM